MDRRREEERKKKKGVEIGRRTPPFIFISLGPSFAIFIWWRNAPPRCLHGKIIGQRPRHVFLAVI